MMVMFFFRSLPLKCFLANANSVETKVMASSDIDSQNKYMKELLQISADEFWTMGIATPAPNYAIKKKNFHNVLAGQIYSWTYPYPAPAETSQYFKD